MEKIIILEIIIEEKIIFSLDEEEYNENHKDLAISLNNLINEYEEILNENEIIKIDLKISMLTFLLSYFFLNYKYEINIISTFQKIVIKLLDFNENEINKIEFVIKKKKLN